MLWPTPRVRDFGGWLRAQHAERQLRDPRATRCLTAFEEQELWREVVLQSPGGADLLEPAGAARAAGQARRTMLEYGIPLHALEAYPGEEVHALADWIARFEDRCRSLDATSGAQLLSELESSAPVSAPSLAWIESPAWRPVARRWLERGGAAIMPESAVPATARGGEAPAARLLCAASADAELAAAADWARRRLESEPDFRAWICIPDLSSRRVQASDALDAALAPRRFGLAPAEAPPPYAIAGGIPLAQFPSVRAALQVLELAVGIVPFSRFSAALRSPELQHTAADARESAALDVALRSRAPSESSLTDWLTLCDSLPREVAPRAAAVARLRAAQAALGQVRDAQPLSRWVAVWVQAFECAPWAASHRWSSGEYQAAERLRELLGELAAADPLFGTRSLRSALRVLAAAVRDTPFQPQTGVPAIAVSGHCTDPWLCYDGLWIAGMSEERFPAPAAPVALLPARLQRQFGVVTASAGMQLEFARDMLARWRVRAPSCVFSHAMPADSSGAVASPLLPAGLPPPAGCADSPRPLWRKALLEAPRLERRDDERAPPFEPGVESTHGVATLRAQSRCAFRGFAETRLGCEPLVKPSPGFDERERGNLVHHALEHVWSRLGSSSALRTLAPVAEAALLADAAEAALGQVRLLRDPGSRWRRREATRLRGLLREWLEAERRREPFEVERLEQGREMVRHAGVDFSVRIDRIDRLADGARVVIDYKTGSVSANWRGERPDNPQLLVYALAHRARLVGAAYGRVSVGACGFVAETARRDLFKPGGRPSNLEHKADLGELLDTWEARVERLAAGFAAGEAQVRPTARACQTCRLHGLCRVATVTFDLDDE